MKPLAQIAYEAFVKALPPSVPTAPWEEARRIPVAIGPWTAVAKAVERETVVRLLAEQQRQTEAARETYRCDCGARLMKGEKHACV